MHISHADKDSFRPIPNVYIVGNPIKSKEMFFGRQEEFEYIRQKITGVDSLKVILLRGGRRSGKTSILKQIEQGHIPEISHAAEAVFCDFHHIAPQLETDEDMPFHIGNTILTSENFHDLRDSFMDGNGSWTARLDRLIRACLEKTKPRVLLLLWDEYETLEELLESGKLTPSAFDWFDAVRDLSVYSIMTGSKDFGNQMGPIFAAVSEPRDIHLLSEKDTVDLIRKPVEGVLRYSDEAVQRIYRLSGGYPFFVQYICQAIVNHLNSEVKRNYAEAKDLDKVVGFVKRNPAGHIQETWRSLPEQSKLTLMSLAHTIQDSDSYAKWSDVIKKAKDIRLPLREPEYNEAVSLLSDKYLIDRQDDGKVRFQIDIFRKWIAYKFQTCEDIDLESHPCLEEKTKRTNLKILLSSGAALLLVIMLFAWYAGSIKRTEHELQIAGQRIIIKITDFISSSLKQGDCVKLKHGIEKPEGIDPKDFEFAKNVECNVDEVLDEDRLKITCLPRIERDWVRRSQWQRCR